MSSFIQCCAGERHAHTTGKTRSHRGLTCVEVEPRNSALCELTEGCELFALNVDNVAILLESVVNRLGRPALVSVVDCVNGE